MDFETFFLHFLRHPIFSYTNYFNYADFCPLFPQSTQDRQRYLASQISVFGSNLTSALRTEFIENQAFIETVLVLEY